MRTSFIKNKTLKKTAEILVALLFWLAVWMLLAKKINSEVLLPSPLNVLKRAAELCKTGEFYVSVLCSLARICVGFVVGFVLGFVVGVSMLACRVLRVLLSPVLAAVKAVPVASFIILALIYMGKNTVPTFTSILVVLPTVAENTLAALENNDKKMVQVCDMYGFSCRKRVKMLYIPQLTPYLKAAVRSSVGMAWKAGVAAEVLCTPKNSIGKSLYEGKIYLETTDVLTWTAVTVVLSVVIEKIILHAVGGSKNEYRP